MATATMKHMASNFAKLDKFEGVDFRRWQKKKHFLLSSMSVVYGLTTPILEYGDDAIVEQLKKRAKKELWDSLEAKYMAEDASSKKFLVSNFINYKMTDSRSVMEKYKELLGILGKFTQHKMNMDDAIQVSCIIDKPPPSWKDFKHTLKHLKEELTLIELGSHLRIEESLKVQDSDKPKSNNVVGPSIINMIEHNNSTWYNDNKGKRKHHDNTRVDPNKKAKPTCWKCGQTGHIKRDFKGVNIGNKANGSSKKGSVDGSSNSLKCHNMFNKSVQTYESLNDGSILHIGNESTALVHGRGCVDLRLNIVNDNIGSVFMSASKLNDLILWHARLGHIHFKRMQDMSKDGLILDFDMDTKKCKTCMLNKITKKPFQNVKRKTEVLELIHSDLCDLHVTPSLGNKKYFVTFIDDALRAVVRLPELKLKTLGERGNKCIFVRYAEHSNAFMFFVIEPNESVSINSIIESRDAMFDENTLSSAPRPSLGILNGTEYIGGSVVSEEVTKEVVQQSKPELKKSKRNRTPMNYEPKFQLYLIKGTRDEVSNQHSYCFNVKDDPMTFDKAMKSQDVAFWKEAINDEMDSIMGNNTWVLADLPPGCKPLGCKWIFKRKLKVDGTVKKFKARLVIQGFRQKSGINYFDTYALLARTSTIRLLIAMASIHNLIIHQMDVKTAFLNGELDEEVYMNQPQGFIMLGNENKDMGEDNVILGIRIKHESKGIEICQSNYIEKVIKKFNYFDCTPVSTPMDTSKKLMPNNGKLSKYTSNPGTQHWQAIQSVLMYLKKPWTID
ncbi:zinc finger, CCHC-type containing protein [Tanacetum coccineum]|uniref:Zinc finger, CCHC-type containing protein n=1 Tax=Tanacetum coccineum TaxID=301880 RepID=A0ABQ5CDR9_9ASTR